MKNRLIPMGILLLGIGLMYIGIMQDEAFVVLKKAVTICLECIGIG